MIHFKRQLLFILLCISCAVSAQALPYTGADITLLATEYTAISGIDETNTPESGEKVWYTTEKGGLWTAWANLWVTYDVELDAGDWLVGLNATNHGNLGDNGWYTYFKISNSLSNDVIYISASDDETNYGYINLSIDEAAIYSVTYTWVNDKYAPDLKLDANIQIDSVFFDNTETAPVPEPATLFLLGSGLLGMAGLRRKKSLK